MSQGYSLTIAVDANLVRDLGGGIGAIVAAMLYNIIQYFDENKNDGWGEITHTYFEQRTTFKRNSFIRAQEKLIKAGLIEKRVVNRENSLVRVTQFRLSKFINEQSGVSDRHISVCQTDTPATEVATPIYNYINNNNLTVLAKPTIPPAPASQAGRNNVSENLANAAPAAQRTMGEKEDSVCDHSQSIELEPQKRAAAADPFAEPVEGERVSIRPDKTPDSPEAHKRKRNFYVLSKFYKYFGWRGKPTAVEAKLIGTALENGWKAVEIGEMLEWQEKDQFYSTATISARLSDNAFKRYDAVIRKQRPQCRGIVYDD